MGSDKVTAYGAERRDEFLWMKPEKITIIGLDTPDTSRKDHPLWDERIHLPVSKKLVRSMVLFYRAAAALAVVPVNVLRERSRRRALQDKRSERSLKRAIESDFHDRLAKRQAEKISRRLSKKDDA